MDGLSSEIFSDNFLALIVDLTTDSAVSYPTRNKTKKLWFLRLTNLFFHQDFFQEHFQE